MADVRKRGKVWYIRWRENGQRKQLKTAARTKDEAEALLAGIKLRIQRGLVGVPEIDPQAQARAEVTVRELCERFLAEYAPLAVKDIEQYRTQARTTFHARIYERLGPRRAADVTPTDLEQLCAQMRSDGYAGASINYTLTKLSRAYSWGKRARVIDCENPCSGMARAKTHKSIDYLTETETGALLSCADDLGPTPTWAAVYLGIFQGLRKGEIFGLRWIDLDVDALRLSVNRSYDGLPKGGEPRHLPMHPEVARVLRLWRARCPETHEGLVVPVNGAMGRRHHLLGLKFLLRRAGCHIPRKPWHALRHTFASHFMMRGGNILTLQKLLGHKDLKDTLIYAHLSPTFMADELGRISFARPTQAEISDLAAHRRQREAERNEWGQTPVTGPGSEAEVTGMSQEVAAAATTSRA